MFCRISASARKRAWSHRTAARLVHSRQRGSELSGSSGFAKNAIRFEFVCEKHRKLPRPRELSCSVTGTLGKVHAAISDSEVVALNFGTILRTVTVSDQRFQYVTMNFPYSCERCCLSATHPCCAQRRDGMKDRVRVMPDTVRVDPCQRAPRIPVHDAVRVDLSIEISIRALPRSSKQKNVSDNYRR